MLNRAGYIVAAGLPMLAACAVTPLTPEQAAQRCEQRAQAAQAPEVGLGVGASSNGGAFGGVGIRLSGDLLRGRDPLEFYETCVIELTGQPPIRPARLRAL